MSWAGQASRTLVISWALGCLPGCSEVADPHLQSASSASATAELGASANSAAESTAGSVRASQTEHRLGMRVELRRMAMGTMVLLASYTDEKIDAQAVHETLIRAHDEIARLEGLMTTWRPDSDVSRVNAAAGSHPVLVSDETFGVITKSQWISERSEGTFDITFASMGKLWRFDEDLVAKLPDPTAVAKARSRIDYRRIKLDEAGKTVMLERSDTQINLGGIAKGYAIDRASSILREAGLESFFAQAGGDLYVEGRKPDGSAWRVGIRDPRGPEGTHFATLEVTDHAFSTAGDYERAFVKGGQRYHHIIDPRTGFPATASRSVTIWAKDALTADAIDDAVFILGPKKGLALVESLEDCGAIIVDQNNKVWISKRLDQRIEMRRQPTDGI